MNISSNALGKISPKAVEENPPLLDLGQIFKLFLRRKWTILACLAGFLAAALAYIIVASPVFNATAVVLVDPRGTRTTTNAVDVIGNIGSDSAAIASQVAVIDSAVSLQRVFEQLHLAQDPEYNRRGLLGRLIETVDPSPEDRNRERLAFEQFRKAVSVDREGLTYVININVRSREAEKAARIANAIAENYINGQVTEKSSASADVTNLLNNRIKRLRDSVSQSEQAVENFKIRHSIFELNTGQTLLKTQVEQLSNRWLQAQEAARDADNRYRQARAIGTSPAGVTRLTEILSSRSAEELRKTYSLKVSALAKARAMYGARHPVRIGLEAEVADLSRLMRQEAERILTELRAAKDLAHSNASAVKRELDKLLRNSDRSQQRQVQLRQLERNADASRKVLEQFLARAKETSQLSQIQQPDARLLSRAMAPVKPIWPRPLLILLVAGVLGLLTGAALALVQRDQKHTQKLRQRVKAVRAPARTRLVTPDDPPYWR